MTINTSLAQSQNHRLIFAAIPNVQFNCTRLIFPGVGGGSVSVGTPFQPIHLSGDSFEHDPLVAEILLNEDYSSWYELYQWISQRTFSQSYDQYNRQKESAAGITSDCTVQLFNSANNLQTQFVFEDVFPLKVSSFTLDSQLPEPQPVTFQAIFEYQKFQKL